MWPFRKKSVKQESLLDQLLGILLETWEKRYTFNLDRENKILYLSVPGHEIFVTPKPPKEVLIRIKVGNEGMKKTTTVEQAAIDIESYINDLYSEINNTQTT